MDEISSGFNYGVKTLEPVFDSCEYKTSRPKNERLVTTSNTNYKKLECFSYAHIVFADIYFAQYNDMYLRISNFEGRTDRVYLESQIQDRQTNASISFTKGLIDDMISCINRKQTPARNDIIAYNACSLG